MAKETTRTCKTCGREFTTTNKARKYCSKACYIRNSRKKPETRKCAQCGNEFTTPYSKRKYCSRECAKKKDYRKPREPQTKVCANCGNEFIIDYPFRKYCSTRCAHEVQLRRSRERPKAKHSYYKRLETRNCVRCNSLMKCSGARTLCDKCKDLVRSLREGSFRKHLRKGYYAVFFEQVNSWVVQPKELALHNRELGKDVFGIEDLTLEKCEKWISSTRQIEIFFSEEDENA